MSRTTGIKIVISDTHLGTGETTGLMNPYEDFHHDDRLAELILHHARDEYTDFPVELIINGDFLDLLKTPYLGRFETEVTEDVALDKTRRCILGHRKVFDALRTFAHRPNHTITYIVGNHDQEIVFPRVQKMIRARIEVSDDDDDLRFVCDTEFLRLPKGVVVTHGNNFEGMNRVEPGQAVMTLSDGRTILNLPFGSRYFLAALAPVKAEQPLIDLVRPLSSFLMWGLLFDLRFTLRLLWSMGRFMLTNRLSAEENGEVGFIKYFQILLEEVAMFNNLERQAFKMLRQADDVTALIVGHSHSAKVRRFPGNKVYVNTGTWVKIVSLELRDLGTRNYLTYAMVEYREMGPPAVRLMRWRGMVREKEEILA